MERIITVILENPYGIVLAIVIFMAQCMRQTFLSNVEIIFMDKKEEMKKYTSGIIVLCLLCLGVNFLLTFDITLIGINVVLFMLVVLFWGVGFIIRKAHNLIYKNNDILKRFVDYFSLLLILTAGPLLIYFITTLKNYNYNVVLALVSIVEAFCLVFYGVGFEIKELGIELISIDNKEKLYIYRKANEEYLLCGNTKKMMYADKIVTIGIEDIYSKKYYLKIKHEKEGIDSVEQNEVPSKDK